MGHHVFCFCQRRFAFVGLTLRMRCLTVGPRCRTLGLKCTTLGPPILRESADPQANMHDPLTLWLMILKVQTRPIFSLWFLYLFSPERHWFAMGGNSFTMEADAFVKWGHLLRRGNHVFVIGRHSFTMWGNLFAMGANCSQWAAFCALWVVMCPRRGGG